MKIQRHKEFKRSVMQSVKYWSDKFGVEAEVEIDEDSGKISFSGTDATLPVSKSRLDFEKNCADFGLEPEDYYTPVNIVDLGICNLISLEVVDGEKVGIVVGGKGKKRGTKMAVSLENLAQFID